VRDEDKQDKKREKRHFALGSTEAESESEEDDWLGSYLLATRGDKEL